MPTTYEKIQSTTLASPTSTVTFQSISSSYTDLVVAWSFKSNSTNNPTLRLTFNNSSTGYSGRQMIGTGAAPTSNSNTGAAFISISRGIGAPNTVGQRGLFLIHIMDYASTNKYKAVLGFCHVPEIGQEFDVGVWANNDAINRIDVVTPTSLDFATDSVITLYGIKAA